MASHHIRATDSGPVHGTTGALDREPVPSPLLAVPALQWPPLWKCGHGREGVSTGAFPLCAGQVAETEDVAIAVVSLGTVHGFLSKDDCDGRKTGQQTMGEN